MLKMIGTGLALAIVAASTMAAQNGAGSNQSSAADDDTALAAKFEQLDTNGDHLLSRHEAEADPTVGSLYDSLDTGTTIEDGTKNATRGGITVDQFKSGIEAHHSGGVVGPAASGGETYKVYPDGSREKVEGTGVSGSGHKPGGQKYRSVPQ